MKKTAAVAVVITASLIAAACSRENPDSGRTRSQPFAAPTTDTDTRGASVALAEIASSPRQPVPSALANPVGPGLPKPLVDSAEILPGGPPPDGIPPIDKPRFLRTSQVDFLRDQEPVIAVTVGGEDRAYPVQILIWHEIVNDTVGGIPVSVTYCPLCNTAIVYDRRAGQEVLDFGTSGELYNSDLVMYDRQTQSLWVQFLGQAVAGFLTGTQLVSYPAQTISWGAWRRAHPDAWVLSRDTGYRRNYGANPYPGYDNIHGTPFLFNRTPDSRLPAMARVVGLRHGHDALAVTDETFQHSPVMALTLDGQPVVVWWQPDAVSPLDASQVAAGEPVGASGAFQPVAGGRLLHFRSAQGGYRDLETGSLWNVEGQATAGPLAGHALTPVLHVDTFWFAWAAFLPDTRLVTR